MNDLIVILIMIASVVVMPLVFFYIAVIVPIKKYKRCSESVEGKVLKIDTKIRRYRTSNGGHRKRKVFIANCEYFFSGEKYTSEVTSDKKFKVSEGEMLSFYINPKNPLETSMRYKYRLVIAFGMAIFLIMFMGVGVYSIVNTFMTKDKTLEKQQVQESKGNEVADNKNTDNGTLESGGQGNSTPEATAPADKLVEDNKVSESVDATTVILNNKNIKNDMNPNFIKFVQKVTVNGVVLCVPTTYTLSNDNELEKEFNDTVTGDKLYIKAGNTTKEIYDHHTDIRQEIMQSYSIEKFDTYVFNGNNFLVTCTKDNSGILFVAAVNDKKNIYIKYEPGKNTTIDLRDILSTIIF